MRPTTTHFAALGMLAAALLAGRAALVVVDVSNLPLAQIPERLGPWTCVEQEMPAAKNTDEAVYMTRVYEHEDGTLISSSFQVTSSRLGALRNWSVAMMGNGWNVEEPWIVGPIAADGLPFDLRLKLQWLHRTGLRRLTATWFVSPGAQAVEYERAQMRGWWDKLVGRCVWGELYMTTLNGDSASGLERATQDLATRLAPHFYAALSDTPAVTGVEDLTMTDGGELDGD